MIGECGHAAVAEVKRLSENTKQLWQCTECGAIGEIEADWFTVLSEARQEGVGYCAAKTRHCPRCDTTLPPYCCTDALKPPGVRHESKG